MQITEEQALEVAYSINKKLKRCPYVFMECSKGEYSCVIEFEYTFRGVTNRCEMYLGDDKSIVCEAGVQVDITSYVNKFLHQNTDLGV